MRSLGPRNPSHVRNRHSQTRTARKTRTDSRYSLLRGGQPKNTIVDEFSNLPISRQRKYQLRMQRDQRCTICGQPAAKGLRCLDHLISDREQTRKRAGYTRRYNNSFSYKMGTDVIRP